MVCGASFVCGGWPDILPRPNARPDADAFHPQTPNPLCAAVALKPAASKRHPRAHATAAPPNPCPGLTPSVSWPALILWLRFCGPHLSSPSPQFYPHTHLCVLSPSSTAAFPRPAPLANPSRSQPLLWLPFLALEMR